MTPYTVRPATKNDEQAITKLLPQLADFVVPNNRDPKDLWYGDFELMQKVLTDTTENTKILVAADDTDNVIAIAMYTLKPELLSGAHSAHLEAIAVHPDHARQGIAKDLINACSDAARKQGATCMSLNVFANNERARALYKACSFDEELIRCYKSL